MNQPTIGAVSTAADAKTKRFFSYHFTVPTAEDEWRRFLDLRCIFNPGRNGRHHARPRAIRKASELGVPKEYVITELLRRCRYAEGGWDEEKVRADVEKFYYSCNGQQHQRSDRTGGERSKAADVAFDVDLRNKIIAGSSLGIDDLQQSSPVKLQSPCAAEVIESLYPPRALLCVGYSKFSFKTRPRETLSAQLKDLQFICPQEMTKEKGITQKGNLSDHSLDNCGPWRFLVIEWDDDDVSVDGQARLICHLRDHCSGKLVLIVHSARRSLHAWFYVKLLTDCKRKELETYARMVGACGGTLGNRSQFVRMPDGFRPAPYRARQAVYYFNPAEAQ
jgi:hypothetical protein